MVPSCRDLHVRGTEGRRQLPGLFRNDRDDRRACVAWGQQGIAASRQFLLKTLGEPLRKVMLLNASVSRDGQAARQHAKRFVSHIVSGWPDDVLKTKGIDPQAIQSVRQAYAENRGVDYAASLTPDEAVDRLIIAGTPAQCTERIAEMFSLAARDEFIQIALGVPLGPDIPEVISLWGTEILPALR